MSLSPLEGKELGTIRCWLGEYLGGNLIRGEISASARNLLFCDRRKTIRKSSFRKTEENLSSSMAEWRDSFGVMHVRVESVDSVGEKTSRTFDITIFEEESGFSVRVM